MPEITVIMSVYNEKNDYLKKAIQSILDQTYSNFTFIIVDDGTSKENKDILEFYKKKDKRIRILVNEYNLGLVKSLNKAIDITDTRYIARMDSDDVSYPERLEKQIDFMEKNKKYALVGTRANYFNENGIYLTSNIYGEITKDMLIRFCVLFHPTIMIRTEVLKYIGGYEEYTRNEDYALYLKLYYYGYKGYILQEVLLDYCQNINTFKNRKYKHRIIEYRVRKKYFKLLKVKLIKRLIYTIKPLIVGLIPKSLLYRYKKIRNVR